MKTLVKALLVLGVALPAGGAIGGAVIAAKSTLNSGIDTTITSGKSDFTMSGGGYTLNLDKRTLHFTIEKGGVTFDSGATLEDDMEITSLRAGFLESAVSLWGLSSNAGESSFAIFDGNHKATTKASVEALDNALVAHISVLDGKKADPTLSMSFDLEYRLEEDGLSLALTNIVDNGSKNVLSAVSLYPGFNMSYGHVNGSFLIPDGSGALIDLSSPTHAQSPLSLRTYGKDIGISSSTRSMESSYQLTLPMYGEYDEEKAMMVTVEEGSEYSELNSKVAGMIDNYNTTYFRFILRDTTYQYLGLSESSKKPIPQSKANNFTPRIHYHLYDEKMDYNGLASKYQSYLLNKGFLKKQEGIAANLRLEFLMGDSKKALFGKTYVSMTSSNFIKTKVAELAKERESLTVDLKGYTAGGFENSYPSSFPIDGAIGNVSELARELKEKGIDLNYRVDTVRSFSDSRGDLARNESQKLIVSSDYVDGTDLSFYRLNNSATKAMVNSLNNEIKNLGGAGACFTSIGYDLFSTHYHENNSRSEAMVNYCEALSSFEGKKAIRRPNLYSLAYADSILDTPVSSSNFVIETENIPFQSLVFSGYTSLFGPSLNLNELGANGLLKLLDYNVLPTYLLTESSAMDLIDSPASSYLYSSKYDVWENDLKKAYDEVVVPLKAVEGNRHLNRKRLAAGVYCNEYEGGTKIVINYSSSNYSYLGKEVKASSFEVIKQ